jgi:hypothetical protein
MNTVDRELNAWLNDYLKPKPRPVVKAEPVAVASAPTSSATPPAPEERRDASVLRRGLYVRELTWAQATALQTRSGK